MFWGRHLPIPSFKDNAIYVCRLAKKGVGCKKREGEREREEYTAHCRLRAPLVPSMLAPATGKNRYLTKKKGERRRGPVEELYLTS